MSDHNPAPRRDPTPKQALANIASQQLQRQAERARSAYHIMIDQPPTHGQYIAVMEVREGREDVLIKRIQPPLHGEVVIIVHEGRVSKVDMRISEKL